ncbi:MAG: heavy-metal-associated domain-containing protein [Gemmatimonadetes bacterium]|nr:heavy-metal-associated domain-containing protein [Gemmatimonadota bacterium]
MRVAVKDLEGVDSVEVSLNRGLVTIRFKPQNRVIIEQVREAIRSNGFTPKAANVRARGTVGMDQGRWVLAFPGGEAGFLLAASPEAPRRLVEVERLRGREVTVEGRVPETAHGAPGALTLEVKIVSGAGGE